MQDGVLGLDLCGPGNERCSLGTHLDHDPNQTTFSSWILVLVQARRRKVSEHSNGVMTWKSTVSTSSAKCWRKVASPEFMAVRICAEARKEIHRGGNTFLGHVVPCSRAVRCTLHARCRAPS